MITNGLSAKNLIIFLIFFKKIVRGFAYDKMKEVDAKSMIDEIPFLKFRNTVCSACSVAASV